MSGKAQAHIKSLRMLTNGTGVFTCAPHNELLSDREPNEAYCLADPGKQYAVYFPDGGEATLDTGSSSKPATAGWLDISAGQWKEQRTLQPGRWIPLRPPGKGPWAVLIRR